MSKCWFSDCPNPVDKSGEHDPFCGASCHEAYAITQGPIKSDGKRKLSIPEMQERLLKMSKEDKSGARLEQSKLL
jgi:hypothetical protein